MTSFREALPCITRLQSPVIHSRWATHLNKFSPLVANRKHITSLLPHTTLLMQHMALLTRLQRHSIQRSRMERTADLTVPKCCPFLDSIWVKWKHTIKTLCLNLLLFSLNSF